MLRDAARSLWAEPRVPGPPVRVWRDWALVVALIPVAVLEGVLREDLVWRVTSVVVALALLPTLLWRRTHPLAAVVAAFGLLTVVDVASLAAGVDWRGLYTNAFVLLLAYALLRWGSGRHAAIGLAVVCTQLILIGLHPLLHPRAEEVPAATWSAALWSCWSWPPLVRPSAIGTRPGPVGWTR